MAQVIDALAPGQNYTADEAILIQPLSPIVAASSTVEWQLLTLTGILLASGSGSVTSAATQPSGFTLVNFTGDIVVPSTVPATPVGQNYILSYSVNLATVSSGNTLYPYQRRVTVVTPTFQTLGAATTVELFGNTATLQLTLSAASLSSLSWSLFQGNNTVVPPTSLTPAPTDTTDGYVYQTAYASSNIQNGARLGPYLVFWQYQLAAGTPVYTEMGKLFLITPRIYQAATALQQYIQRAIINLDQTPDIIFKPEDLLGWLSAGAAAFNTFGQPTNFSMVNASDPIMYYWVIFAAVNALRSQFLVESLKSFEFSGQAVSLTVDHAGAFESLANTLEQQVQEPCRQFKTILSKRGFVSGDGNVDPTGLAYGAIGSVGISLNPISNLFGFNNSSSWLGVGRII